MPKKIGSHLELFDCITCDKCVPVCPNGANFTFVIPPAEIPVQKLRRVGDGWESSDEAPIVIEQKHQIGNFADFCNDCGNCDVFCPEDGGPYAVKPRFFGSAEAFRDEKDLDGFHVERNGVSRVVAARFDGREFHLELNEGEGRVRFSSVDFSISFDPDRPGETAEGTAAAEVDLTYFHIMDLIQRAVLGDRETNYVAMQSSD